MEICGQCGRNSHNHVHELTGGLGGEPQRPQGPQKDNGMVCSTWGPPRWFSLHMTTFGYPLEPSHEQKENMKLLIRMWEHELPCCCCRKNYKAHLAELLQNAQKADAVVSTREALVQFGFELHNVVNKALGKPVLNEDALNSQRRMYESCRAGLSSHTYAHATIALRNPEHVRTTEQKNATANNQNQMALRVPIFAVDQTCVLSDAETRATSEK
jgi:hypothetical protein